MWSNILSGLFGLISSVWAWFGGKKQEKVLNAEEQAEKAVRQLHAGEDIPDRTVRGIFDWLRKARNGSK